jgi:nitrogen-specific signal transduction histidine kinase
MIDAVAEVGSLADEILKGVKLVEGLIVASDMNEFGLWGLTEAVLLVSPIGIIQKSNPAADQLFSESAGQLLGRSLSSLLRDNQELLQIVQNDSNGEGVIEIPIKHLTVKGNTFSCSIRSVRGVQAHCLIILPLA